MKRLENRWREISAHPESSQFQRIDESHPLDFYIGREASGNWMLLLITQERTRFHMETHAIHVFCQRRGDERWAVMFRLMKPDLEKLFSLVCEDLIESSRSNPNPSHPASFVLARFKRWQRMLEKDGSGLLNDAALRGLAGELLFLEMRVLPERGGSQAMDGWCGPLGADRDFCFPDREFEVKTVHDGADRILVSSAEQLDPASKPVDLGIVVLDDVPPGALPDAFTIIDLVNRLRQTLADDPTALEMFDLKLIDAGLVLCEDYAERAFILYNIRIFNVTDSFPAIRRSSLPFGVGNVRWELVIQSILPFEVITTR